MRLQSRASCQGNSGKKKEYINKVKQNYFCNGTWEIYEWDSVMWLPKIAKIWTWWPQKFLRAAGTEGEQRVSHCALPSPLRMGFSLWVTNKIQHKAPHTWTRMTNIAPKPTSPSRNPKGTLQTPLARCLSSSAFFQDIFPWISFHFCCFRLYATHFSCEKMLEAG